MTADLVFPPLVKGNLRAADVVVRDVTWGSLPLVGCASLCCDDALRKSVWSSYSFRC